MQSNLRRWMLLCPVCIETSSKRSRSRSARKYFVTFTLIWTAYPARYVVTVARTDNQLGSSLRPTRSSARRKLTAAALCCASRWAVWSGEKRRDVTRGRARDPWVHCNVTRVPLALSTRLLRWHRPWKSADIQGKLYTPSTKPYIFLYFYTERK